MSEEKEFDVTMSGMIEILQNKCLEENKPQHLVLPDTIEEYQLYAAHEALDVFMEKKMRFQLSYLKELNEEKPVGPGFQFTIYPPEFKLG
jgi:hypothetical protein